MAPPPERAGEKYARLVDHDLSWALTNLRRDGLVTRCLPDAKCKYPYLLNPAETPAKLAIPTLDSPILGATIHLCVSESQATPVNTRPGTPWTC
jgi:hypothetical protein